MTGHKARRQEMVALYAKGLSLAKIGEKYGVSRQAVHQALTREGFPRRDKNDRWRHREP